MDEFRKPFEYDDEKGLAGILLILFMMLISVEPLLGIISIPVVNAAFPDSKVLKPLLIALCIIYIVFSLFSGVVLKKLYSFAVAATKVFLVYRMILFIPVLILNMTSQIKEISYQVGSATYMLEYNNKLTSFVISISYAIVFSAGWYIYLNKSKRVHESFPQKSRLKGERDFKS